MGQTTVLMYREAKGQVPILEFFDAVPQKVRVKLVERVERLEELGHELRRPLADFLEDGIYELRVRHQRVNYRLLYCFHGRGVALLSHGCTKEAELPKEEVNRAKENRARFIKNPQLHTATEKV